jgi:hypothetical protein
MAKFCRKNLGLRFVLVAILLGLPFFHYHPDNTHTHQSELSPHFHGGHFHSQELHGFVDLIDHDAENSRQSEDHHSHSETDQDANYFDVNLQKSDLKPAKTLKVFKVGNTQKSLLVSGSQVFRFVGTDRSAVKNSESTFIFTERSPPFFSV